MQDDEAECQVPVIQYLRNLQRFPKSKIKKDIGMGPAGNESQDQGKTEESKVGYFVKGHTYHLNN